MLINIFYLININFKYLREIKNKIMALNKIFKPFFVNDLIRIGHKCDGGYIISRKILAVAENVITFGLFDEFSFEKNILKLKKK